MKALVFNSYGAPQTGRVAEVDAPKVKDGFLLVRIRAAGVNAFDYELVTGAVKEWMPLTFPYIPGMDGAGEVIDVGSGVTDWRKGDRIAGLFSGGTFAQYALIAASEKNLARLPDSLDFGRAAAIPESGLTARTMLRAGPAREGQTAFVIGATGGLGLFTTQLVKAAGARVIATGKPGDFDYFRQLGVDEMVDYTSGDTIARVKERYPDGVDIVFDVINRGEALLRDAEILRPGGTIISSLEGPDQSAFPAGITVRYIEMKGERGDLDDLVQRTAAGALQVEIGATYDLSQAAQAIADLADPAKHIHGKIVVQVA